MRADRRLFLFAAVSLGLLRCASTPSPERTAAAAPAPSTVPATKPAPERVAANTPRSTPGGTTFTVPSDWTLESDGARTLLTGSEPDIRIALVDSPLKNADEAVASAWRVFRQGFNRPLKLAKPRPGRNGWDEARDYEYETSPNEKLIVTASAFRHGDAWSVVLYEV